MTEGVPGLLAYCGLYCGDCIRYYGKSAELAAELLEELDRVQYADYARAQSESPTGLTEMADYDRAVGVLRGIARLRCVQSCRAGGGCSTFDCGIIACCREKGLKGCWECDDFEACEMLDFLTPFHGEVKQWLRDIRDIGLEKWLANRPKFYAWL